MTDLLQYLTPKVKQNIQEAISDHRIHYLERDGKTIGFHTWEEKGDKIFINNLWIEEQYRNKNNLLSLRKYFRDMYSGKVHYWRNRKRGEYEYFK